VIVSSAEDVAAKVRPEPLPSEIVKVYPGDFPGNFSKGCFEKLRQAVARLTPQSRLYIDGHGDWENQKIGCWDAFEVVELLVRAGLVGPEKAVKLVSITSCFMGRGPSESKHDDVLLDLSAKCFATELHRNLKVMAAIQTVVHARTAPACTIGPRDGLPPEMRGRKGVATANAAKTNYRWDVSQRHRPHSKKKFYWEGDKQCCCYIDYEKKEWFA
jgi:hypothetical protein